MAPRLRGRDPSPKQSGSNVKKPKGFKIGQLHHSKRSESYRGKAEQIKKTLIHKAKLKKQRAKELIRAGYSADRRPNSSPIANASRRDQTDLNEDAEMRDPDTSMNIDSPRSLHPKLGPRKDGMRIDKDNDSHHSCPGSLKRHHSSSSSSEVKNKSNSHKRKKVQDPPLAITSSIGSDSKPSPSSRSPKSDRNRKAQLHHANGQPKLSIKLARMLNKIQRDS